MPQGGGESPGLPNVNSKTRTVRLFDELQYQDDQDVEEQDSPTSFVVGGAGGGIIESLEKSTHNVKEIIEDSIDSCPEPIENPKL
jgi:hypothetical protein